MTRSSRAIRDARSGSPLTCSTSTAFCADGTALPAMQLVQFCQIFFSGLCKLDRLPKANPLQGLQLLQDADGVDDDSSFAGGRNPCAHAAAVQRDCWNAVFLHR